MQGNVPSQSKSNSPDSKSRSAAIAAALARHPDVADAPVIARQRSRDGGPPAPVPPPRPQSAAPIARQGSQLSLVTQNVPVGQSGVPTSPTALSQLSSADPVAVINAAITPAAERMLQVSVLPR